MEWKPQLNNCVAFVRLFKYWTKEEGLRFLRSANVKSEHFQIWGAFIDSEILNGDGGKGEIRFLAGKVFRNNSQGTGSLPWVCNALQSTGRGPAFSSH